MGAPEIRTLAETGSTNDDMRDLARSGVEEGIWLRAERQAQGRGRQGRSWDSPAGNLYASTLVRLRASDPPAASLALVAGIALWDAVDRHLRAKESLMLKWPNDLLIGSAKLAGILLEREGDCVVIGCGANLAHHPEGLERPVTSLAAHGPPPAAADFAETLAEISAGWLDRWRTQGLPAITSAWIARAHPVGTPLTVQASGGDRLDGSFDGLAEDGALRLRLADGAVRVIHAGDVFLI